MGASIEDGRLSGTEVIVRADGNNIARATHSIATETSNSLQLTVDDSADPVPAGGTVTYNLTYANRGISTVSGATLSFPVPAGATLVNQTGGTVTGNVITWNLGTLAAGQAGRRRVRMSVGGGANPGDLLAIDAGEIAGTLSTPRSARGTAATRIATAPALQLVSGVSPNPVLAGASLTPTLTLTNTTGSSLSGVVLRLRVPTNVNSFSPTLLSPTGPSCTAYFTGSCDAYEVLNWSVGTLGAGASFVASIPPVVTAGNATGLLIPVTGLAQDDAGDSAAASTTAVVGTFTDNDGDGVAQIFDNCLNVSNVSQLDTNFDGYGNICDGDLNNSLLTTTADFTLLRSVLNFGSGTSALAADADMNGSGLVTTADFTLLRSYINSPPGPSGMAP
jgi:hypothetical protein